MSSILPDVAASAWELRFAKDQEARENALLGARGGLSPRAQLVPLYVGGRLAVVDGDGRKVTEGSTLPCLSGLFREADAALFAVPEVKLVDDLRCFQMLALLYLGPVAVMHFPTGTHIVGSCVQMCLCVRKRPYDAARETLLREWRARRDWYCGVRTLVFFCLERASSDGASVDKVADLIYLYARESELELGKRVTAAQGPAQAVLDGQRFLPPGTWDPMEWESNAEGVTRHADIDVCFCQETEIEALRAVVRVHEQLISHFGPLPMRRTPRHGTVTYFLPWPWRRVQLKCGRRPLLHWLMDADAAPTACCLSLIGVALPATPYALPRAVEAFEHKTNVLHMRTLLHRQHAPQRAAKYAGRGFKPLFVQCRPEGHAERQEVRRAMGDVARSFTRQKHMSPIPTWSASWQSLRETLIMGAEEELAAAVDEEGVAQWCRAGAFSHRLPECLLPLNGVEARALSRRNRAQAAALSAEDPHAEDISTEAGTSSEAGASFLADASEDALSLDAASEGAGEVPSARGGGALLEALRRYWRNVQPYHTACIGQGLRPETSLQLALQISPLAASTPGRLQELEAVMLRYFGNGLRRVKPVLTDDGYAILGGAPRVLAEVYLSYLSIEETQGGTSAAELFLTVFMRLAPDCAAAITLWKEVWKRRLLKDSTDEGAQWLHTFFDYSGPGGAGLGERVQDGCPDACAIAFDKQCPEAETIWTFQEAAENLAELVKLPAREWMEHGFVRRRSCLLVPEIC